MLRKSVSLLNQLKHDLEDSLKSIEDTGVALDNACYDLAKIHPHDVKTDDDRVKMLFINVQLGHKELGKQLEQFKKSRDSYLTFF